jgi:hypothetical protein
LAEKILLTPFLVSVSTAVFFAFLVNSVSVGIFFKVSVMIESFEIANESFAESDGFMIRLSGFTEAESVCATAKTESKKNKIESKKYGFMQNTKISNCFV